MMKSFDVKTDQVQNHFEDLDEYNPIDFEDVVSQFISTPPYVVTEPAAPTLTLEEQRTANFNKAMLVLEDEDAQAMMDGIEVEETGAIRNNRFGTYGLQGLASLTPEHPYWDKYAPNTTIEERTRIISAARVASMPENQDLVTAATGGDSIFEDRDIANWNVHVAGQAAYSGATSGVPSEANKFTFIDSLALLASPAGVQTVDRLEMLDGVGIANGRFGVYGIQRLAGLTVDSSEWAEVNPEATPEQRQNLINAAQVAIAPENQHYMNEASGGDSIFEANEMQNWLASHREGSGVSDQVIGSFSQGAEGNCWALASISAVADTPAGRQMLGQAITQNPDGTYTVTFPGDPSRPIVVTEDDLRHFNSFSTGDKDVKILEVAMEKYAQANPEWLYGKTTTTEGGNGLSGIELLTGSENISNTWVYFDDAATIETLHQLAQGGENQVIYFSSEVDFGTALPGNYGNGSSHAFYIEEINLEAGTVTFTNPWNTDNPITMSIEEFAGRVRGFQTTTLS